MDIAVWTNQGDVTKSRHRLKRPSHLQLTCHRYEPFVQQPVPSSQYDDENVNMRDLDEVADLLIKMNYRICDDGFYIPSPATPNGKATFTFDNLYPDLIAINQFDLQPVHIDNTSIHSPEHLTKNGAVFAETNVYNLMDSILYQQQQSLPSCQYDSRTADQRTPELRFTPNIAESIMTEELNTNYDDLPDINEKSPDECILDDALDQIEARQDDDDEEVSSWKAEEETEIWKAEECNVILSLTQTLTVSCSSVVDVAVSHRQPMVETVVKQTERDTEMTTKQKVSGVERMTKQKVSEVERVAKQRTPEVQALTDHPIQTSGLAVLKEMGRLAAQIDGRRYICDLCGRGFGQGCTMRNHRRTHTGERPFMCSVDLCTRSFSDMSSLRKHRRVHTKDRPFTCDVCDKTFAQSGNLYRHKRNIHPVVVKETQQLTTQTSEVTVKVNETD